MATDLRNVYEKYLFHGPFSLNLKTCLHESVGNHTVVDLIKETHFVVNCGVCDFSFILNIYSFGFTFPFYHFFVITYFNFIQNCAVSRLLQRECSTLMS